MALLLVGCQGLEPKPDQPPPRPSYEVRRANVDAFVGLVWSVAEKPCPHGMRRASGSSQVNAHGGATTKEGDAIAVNASADVSCVFVAKERGK